MTGVAVVIPCFNLGRTLRQAIDSVRVQTQPASELVIVDDGSTDLYTRHALAAIRAEGLAVIRTRHEGVAGARSVGIKSTAARYILMLDADDMLMPAAIERLAGVLDANPAVDFVTCGLRAFGEAEYVWHPPACKWPEALTRGGPHISTMLRRTVWNDVGGFDPDLPGYEDTDFWLEALRRGFRGGSVPEVLLRYRVRARSRYAQALNPDTYRRAMASIYARHWPPPQGVSAADVLLDKEVFLEAQREYQRTLIHRREELEERLNDTKGKIASVRAELASRERATIDWGDLRRMTPVSSTSRRPPSSTRP
jgi:glycosyltransferase involved in cell wall biosynthesis